MILFVISQNQNRHQAISCLICLYCFSFVFVQLFWKFMMRMILMKILKIGDQIKTFLIFDKQELKLKF